MLRYLVDPIFQVINTAGKPATGGYIEVYLHGTRDKYYCASDFNGTLHPFKIPLDSLGANIILADDANAYDIYVYNRYGSLLMSRYNVAPVQGGGCGGGNLIGKVHFLKAVSDHLADVRAPYSFWIVDLEKPNADSPYGYDYAMADEIIAKLSAGEVFVLSTYPTAPSSEEDLYIMSTSALQSREGHEAVRIWFTRMFAANSPEYMYFTTIYTPSMYNNNPNTNYPEGRMAILNWRGQQDSRSEFHFMPYTELATVATTGDYDDLNNKPTIPAAQVQSDWSQSDNTQVNYIKNKPNLALKENVSNKIQTINATSETEYPSSKAVADFVNSSVATNTANFLGTLSESSLGLDYTATNAQIALALNVHSWDSPPTNNDYCFVSVNDPQTTDVDEYRRFKFNGSVWAYEYTLNNSSFTQAQWNAINSGIDSSDKATYDAAVTLLSNHVNDHNNPHNVTAAQIGAESTTNKAESILDPTSETEYPSSKAVAGFVFAISNFINEKIQRGLNTKQTNSQAYSLVGTLNVTDDNHRGMMGFELFCCKECANPIRMHGTFGYQADNNLNASYSKESAVNSELARYKLAWRFANDHTSNNPKIEIWLIDTINTGAFTRRCGCVVHMVSGIEWIDGNQSTNTLPSGLTDFTPFYT